MVPFLYVPVNRIPLAPTGKTDRRRLKALGASLTAEDLAKFKGVENKPKRDPSTALERQVRDLWAEILAIPPDRIGIDDNFLQLGGDSISAMRLLSLARARGLSLDSRNLFISGSTLADLAAKVSHASAAAVNHHQVPFSQLQTRDIQGFLMANIAPHIDYPASSIDDAFPVTDFQAECINAAIHQKPPAYWNYFYIDLPMSDLTIDAVSAACQAVAMHLPILRSVFVPYGSDFLQLVTIDLTPEFSWFRSTAKDIATTSERLAREDWLNSHVRTGTVFARFMLILADDESSGARLIIRMSHALYDGISLGPLLHAVVAAIEGRPLPSVGSFASFVQHLVAMRGEASRYWGKLLSGSSMTQMPRVPRANNDVGGSTPYIVRRTIRWQTSLPEGVTAATFCTACWAAVIAFTTQQADVVFGRLVSGRGPTLGVISEPVAGPCLNVIPVRVTWPPRELHTVYSPHEVFATIQQQQLDGLPFESTGLSQIIASCTDWPADTAFGSIFQYQNIDETPSASLNGAPVHLDAIPMDFRPKQLWVLVKPLAQGLNVSLFGTTGIMAQEHAQTLGDQFCKYVEMGGMLQDM
ncbi:hypothetical protein BJX61DRAFT_507128 [Aspergillus egyptiacus]|nr:hypothetical protein BJX61DRAFT_507128 [Aspergillus egyptiacus]